MQGLQVLSLSTLSWVPAFPELSLLALPPGVAHICAEGQCVRCRQFIQQNSLVCVSCPYALAFGGHEATETGLAYAPVSEAHGHNHIVQCFACCTAA